MPEDGRRSPPFSSAPSGGRPVREGSGMREGSRSCRTGVRSASRPAFPVPLVRSDDSVSGTMDCAANHPPRRSVSGQGVGHTARSVGRNRRVGSGDEHLRNADLVRRRWRVARTLHLSGPAPLQARRRARPPLRQRHSEELGTMTDYSFRAPSAGPAGVGLVRRR